MFERITRHFPGWDCLYAPCQHEHKGEHGIHAEEILHALATEAPDGRRVVLSFTLTTDRYPPTIPQSHFAGSYGDLCKPRGSDLTLHIQGLRGSGNSDCMLVSNCEVDYTSSLAARDLWNRVAQSDQDLDQPGSTFWNQLEMRLRESLADPVLFRQPDEPRELTDARSQTARKDKIEAEERLVDCEKRLLEECGVYSAHKNKS